MKKWILLFLAALVFLSLVVRERLTNYQDILAAMGQSAGYLTPSCDNGYAMNGEQTECLKPKSDGTSEKKDPTCPDGSSFEKQGNRGVCRPTSQSTASSGSTDDTPSCPQGYRLAVNDKCVRESEPLNGNCSVGVLSGNKCYEIAEPVCPSGKTVQAGKCVGGSSTPSTPPRTSTAPPTGIGKDVWGPAFPGLGEGSGLIDGDSTKTTIYPTLLGGFMGRNPSEEAARSGTSRSSSGSLGGTSSSSGSLGGTSGSGAIPSPASLGTDANSGFLPYSRQPGDMDLIPDPYRVSSTFSTSTYSSTQKEPAPFLTDFSAFTK